MSTTQVTTPDTALPVADAQQVRDAVVGLLKRHPRAFALMVGLHGAAALAGLVAPRMLGEIVDDL